MTKSRNSSGKAAPARRAPDSKNARKQPAANDCTPVILAPGDYSSAYARMSEHQIQAALFRAYAARGVPGTVMFAIPNGGARDKVTAKLLKDEGVKAGAPDIFTLVAGVVRLAEVKTEDGVLSGAQIEMHSNIDAAGGQVCTVHGFIQAVQWLEDIGILRRAL